MKAYDIVGYTWEAEVFCLDCRPEGPDSEGNEPQPIFADSEWDYQPYCSECSEPGHPTAIDVQQEHRALVHPDGSECPDGCGGGQ